MLFGGRKDSFEVNWLPIKTSPPKITFTVDKPVSSFVTESRAVVRVQCVMQVVRWRTQDSILAEVAIDHFGSEAAKFCHEWYPEKVTAVLVIRHF